MSYKFIYKITRIKGYSSHYNGFITFNQVQFNKKKYNHNFTIKSKNTDIKSKNTDIKSKNTDIKSKNTDIN